MAEKDFKVKSGLIVGGLLSTGVVKNSTVGGTVTVGSVDLSTSEVTGTLTAGKGGTGVANSGTITVSGNTTIGSSTHTVAFTTSANTSVTLPSTGTLATLAGSESLTNKKLGSLTSNGLVTTSGGDGTLSVTVPAAGILTFLTTPSSANLLSAVTDETGSGLLVFGTSPAITTSLTTGSASFDLINATATTVNFAGAATALSMGATTGTTTINNATLTLSNATTVNVNGASPTFASSSTGTLTLFNTNLTTVNAFGAATTATEYGAATSLTIGGASAAQTITIGGASTGASTYNFGTGTTAASNTKTINIGTGGAASSITNINLGSSNGGTVTVNKDLVISGDLTVNGTTVTVNSTTISVDDKNIELGSVTTPTDTTADGGGITLKGATDKTFNWVNATGAWTSSEHLNLASGKAYRVNGTEVISSSGGWSGSVITVAKGGTNIASYAVGDILYADGATSLAKLAGVATGNVLISGGVTTAPAWGKVGLTTHVSGTLAVGNGGTGATTFTANGILYGNTTSAIQVTGAGTQYQVLQAGASGVPTFGALNLSQSAAITGTLPVANGGTGQTSYTDGQLLIGNTSGNTLTKATLTAGTGISITNGNGSITISSTGATISSFTLSAATATAVDTTTASGVRGIEYTLTMQQGTGTAMKVRTSKVLCHYNSGLASPVVDSTEFAVIETGSALMAGVNVAAVLNGANIELQVTITDANTTNVQCRIAKTVLS